MALPSTFNVVEVRGRYLDFAGAAVVGRVEFTPSVVSATVEGESTIVIAKMIPAELVNGFMSIYLPATDDPDVQPPGFFYAVRENFVSVQGRSYNLQVPIGAAGSGIEIASEGPTPQPNGVQVLVLIDGGGPNSTYSTPSTPTGGP